MSANRYEVEGRVFYNRIDYEAALRDLEKIKEIKSSYDLKNAEDIKEVYAYLAGGSYRFESRVGDDFDDEIYTLYSSVKDKPQNTSAKEKPSKSKKTVTFADCDEELQAAVKEELHKQEKRRKFMI